MFAVHEAERKNHPYEVRYNDGRCYCRCISYRDANQIALALNLMKDRESTKDTLRAVYMESAQQ